MTRDWASLSPGSFPRHWGKLIEYSPTLPEILIQVGIWAVGLLIITLLYRIAVSVKLELQVDEEPVVKGR